jgi:hypothetical protein
VTPHLDQPPSACSLCGRSTWWRSRSPVGPWICAVCVEPLREPGEVEFRDGIPVPEERP